MHDYIPSKDIDRVGWLLHFGRWLTDNGGANALAHGITWAQAFECHSQAGHAASAVTAAYIIQAEAHAAAIDKDQAIAKAEATARAYAQKLQHDLDMTDADRAAAGITVPDLNHTPPPPDTVAEMEPPLLLLDFHLRHQVSIHWGPNPGNEHQNTKPRGVMGCELQYARGGIPTEDTGWISLGLDTDSPMLHHPADMVPTLYAYRARYVDKKLNYGNFGDPVECTVSV